MSDRLMVLGADACLLKRACELGFEVHAFGLKEPKQLLFAGKEVVFHKQDILDYDSLWEACKKLEPKGVVSIASELAMHPMHFLLRKMGIPCNCEWTEQTTTNKYRMRNALMAAGLDSPKFTLVTNQISQEEFEKVIREFNFPLIIKPTDSSASRGIMKIDRKEDLNDAISFSLGWSKMKECIIEEFVEGTEYSGESIAYNGHYTLLAVTEKQTTGAPHFVEKTHRQPAALAKDILQKVKETLYKAFAALKIEYGAIHPEFRITKDGRVLFMEIATRMGGGHIGTELTPLSSGYDFLGMVINVCCGREPIIKKEHPTQKAEVHFIISEEDVNLFHEMMNNPSYNIVSSFNAEKVPNGKVINNIDRSGYYIVTQSINC